MIVVTASAGLVSSAKLAQDEWNDDGLKAALHSNHSC
jgi:hypothetical protein